MDELNPLNIEARYPEYKEQIAKTLTPERCKAIIAKTEELLCWIKKQL
ncbi:MAG: HEPN domain-containing protein [Clostridiales bacterium]|nr:HEPN domain-containing protein [Clostridiales bacterium]